MTRRTALTLLDTSMLLAFLTLSSWRFTGLAAHEWIGLALIAFIVVHLLVHWSWVESSVLQATRPRPGHRRPLVSVALNAALFLAMGTALVSGLAISKVVVPNGLSALDYMRWHGLHESSATLAVLMVGLHVALNWERIRSALRRLRRRGEGVSAGAGAVARAKALGMRGSLLPRLAWVLALCALLALAVDATARMLPAPQVLMVFPDGHQERRAPPPEIARFHPGDNAPLGRHWPKRLLGSIGLLAMAAVAGRYVLRLRLGR